jgi:lactoylglutathione lyase
MENLTINIITLQKDLSPILSPLRMEQEVMRKTGVDHSPQINITGWAHVAFSVGSKARVNEKTEQLMHAGYEVVGQPRLTGDGYYESVIKDPEGNLVEISM